jgi:hypothetical protein
MTHPNSLKDSNVNPKVKTMEEGVGVRSLVHSTSWGKKGVLKLQDGDKGDWQACQLFISIYTNQITSWLVHNSIYFGAWMNHGHTQTHKIHHNLNLGKATTFFYKLFFMIHHETTPKWHFSRNSKLGVSQFLKLGFSPLSLEGKGQNATITFTTTCNYLIFATKFLLSTTIVTSCWHQSSHLRLTCD